MNTTSPSLIERLRTTEDQQAWGRFVELYSPLLYYWAHKIGLSRDQAADLVQDVCLVLMDKLPEFDYDASRSFRGWLRTITLNKCRDQLRRQARGPRNERTGEMAKLDVSDNVEFLGEQEYREQLVRRALQLMETEFEATTWRACWEHVVSGKSAERIAAELGMSVNAVYLAKSRVLRRLREELAGLLDP
ncbi:MAG: sigma-70 family RNA polymerase sigma factor [Planctomycetota bacterium]|mgnify:CR=1 FL=1|nr:MAG: sigma-70 family RNA polymerase sigma factor [Planctomycetota bacterium]REK25650.1 MAG: sigma-70 family RNA polymerase sigma factor [Planctomycetota bacterium]REK31638.1 MAG: sigma-70 family RNA polymerase sigma factor [Planctomycetota bacterium]